MKKKKEKENLGSRELKLLPKVNRCFTSRAKIRREGQPQGRGVGFTCSASAAQGFAGSDPGHGPSTTRRAILGWRPTWQNWRDLQLEYTTIYWRALGGKKKDWQQMLAQVPSFKTNKKKTRREQAIALQMAVSLCPVPEYQPRNL